MKVIALRVGYYDDERRRVGDVFSLLDPRHFSARWMAVVDDDTPETQTGSQAALTAMCDDRLGREIDRSRPEADALEGTSHDFDPWSDACTEYFVPIGRYVTELAASEHHTFFVEEAHLAPDAQTARETRALDEQVAAEITSSIAAIAASSSSSCRPRVAHYMRVEFATVGRFEYQSKRIGLTDSCHV
jgi:hypothetical protein